jgi:hypothetical protein
MLGIGVENDDEPAVEPVVDFLLIRSVVFFGRSNPSVRHASCDAGDATGVRKFAAPRSEQRWMGTAVLRTGSFIIASAIAFRFVRFLHAARPSATLIALRHLIFAFLFAGRPGNGVLQ